MHRFTKIYMHLIWATKDRQRVLRGALEKTAHEEIRAAARERGMVPVATNSAWNHTHALLSWNPACSVVDTVKTLKARSARAWNRLLEDDVAEGPKLEWQVGFSAFSVGPKAVGFTQEYVIQQKSRHQNLDLLGDHELPWIRTPGKQSGETSDAAPGMNSGAIGGKGGRIAAKHGRAVVEVRGKAKRRNEQR